jgi:RND family efflux transporter MFP subunit
MLSAIALASSVVAGAGFTGAATFGCAGRGDAGGKAGQGKGKQRPAPLVSVSAVERRDVPVEVQAPVDLRPLFQAEIGSKTLGYLDAVLVDRGDKVTRGQLLAVVRPSDLPDQLSSARSALAQAQSSAALARTNFERAKALAPEAVVSQQELQQSSAQLASAEAAEQAARSQIGALAVRLGETRIVSPLSGVVLHRRLDPGALVGPPGGGNILTVARIDPLRVFINVNERDAAALAVGKDAHVELDAQPGKSFQGKVVRVAPAYDPTTRTLEAEVQLPNTEGLLRPGMYGRGSIVLEVHRNVPVLPVGAVQLSDGKAFAFVVEGGDTVKRRAIQVGVDGGTWLEVTGGLSGAETVVVAGTDAIAEGVKVRVARDVDPYTGRKAPARSAATPPSRGGDAGTAENRRN